MVGVQIAVRDSRENRRSTTRRFCKPCTLVSGSTTAIASVPILHEQKDEMPLNRLAHKGIDLLIGLHLCAGVEFLIAILIEWRLIDDLAG